MYLKGEMVAQTLPDKVINWLSSFLQTTRKRKNYKLKTSESDMVDKKKNKIRWVNICFLRDLDFIRPW